MRGKTLKKSFYARDTRKVARELLGKRLVRKLGKDILVGIIVETEAYRGYFDSACHGYRGKTKRCEAMFAGPGRVYIYLVYGIHYMLNLVTEKKDFPSAVLIRALEPLEGVDRMVHLRSTKNKLNLTSGPGKLTQAFAIDKSLNRVDLVESEKLWVEEGKTGEKIKSSPRIGIDYACKKSRLAHWRYFLDGNPFVSS